MRDKGGKAPKPPDPVRTAQTQTQTNIDTAIAQQQLNNVNQVTPWGNLTYTQTGTGQNGVPMYTATQTLTPEQQNILDLSNQADTNLAGLAVDQSSRLNDLLSEPVDLSNEATEARLFELGRQRLDPLVAQRDEDLRTRLANQGIKVGSQAYDREMANFGQSTNDAYNQLLLTGRGQATQEALAERNQPINEITALLSGSQVSQPNFVSTNPAQIPTVDIAGLTNANYNQQMAAYNQQQAQRQNLMGGLFGLGASAITAFSDKRLKKDVKKVGELDGHALYRYRYKGAMDDGQPHVGVMAQEVEKDRPEVVVTYPDGSKAVKYGELFGARA